ncbi:MAG: hypothetical protein ACFFC3_00530 [Candidatus Odinarchaeota archaeon]
MTDNFDYDVLILVKEWNFKTIQISSEIQSFIDQNKGKISKSFSHIREGKKLFLSLIKLVFLYLKNCTNLLNNLTIIQIREISPIIFHIGKKIFSLQWIIYDENQFLRKINNLYGFIYVAINQATKNKMVYVGQTIRTIEEEWGEIFSHGKVLRKKRNEQPLEAISARYIHNAIAKYPDDAWDLRLIDLAYSQSELDNKESHYIVDVYDSMNPDNGYNLTTGGRSGGRLSPITKNKVSQSVSDVWNTPGYRERLSNSHLEAWDNDERREECSKRSKELWKTKKRQEQATEDLKKRWDNKNKRKRICANLSNSAKKSWQNPTKEMLNHLKEMHEITTKKIPNIKEFLTDIKNIKYQRDFLTGSLYEKYGIKTEITFNKRIREILGGFGVNNHGEAHRFFYDRTVDHVFRYINSPEHYNLFEDPHIIQFLKDIKNSENSTYIHEKYDLDYQSLRIKIKRIFGEFNLVNYTELKQFLQDRTINESLFYFKDFKKA